jgi:hypothetical protein
MAIHEDHLYIACGPGGLVVVEVSRPAAPVTVATLEPSSGDFVNDVAIDYPHAWLAAGMGVHLVDISEPGSPREIRYLDTPGHAVGIAAAEGRALVGDTYGLGIYSPGKVP